MTDLGSWPPAQARALVRVLRSRGIATTTIEGADVVRVEVADDVADAAQRAMAEEMDTIAEVARAEQRDVERQRRARQSVRDVEDGPPLVMERFRNLGPWLAVLVAALMVGLLIPGPYRLLVVPAAILLIVWLTVRRRDDREHGPGAR